MSAFAIMALSLETISAMTVRIKDVAAAAGVSVATVSRALAPRSATHPPGRLPVPGRRGLHH
ncbi:LacI family DNA-binding transcriptional regulator, partial [Ralstonia pseudosolanacearum]|uniref:LacI family DNA-binding transcriptional regulator n=1 Tax=Ralstonia pseudosolanacearum TaxID=1310165 RepID=UPI0032215A15